MLRRQAYVLLRKQHHTRWFLQIIKKADEHAHVQVCRRLCETFTPAQVFAPLARLLGLYSIKEELEALSFQYSDPEAYAAVQRRLDALAKQQGDVVLSVSLDFTIQWPQVAVAMHTLSITPVGAKSMMRRTLLLCLGC